MKRSPTNRAPDAIISSLLLVLFVANGIRAQNRIPGYNGPDSWKAANYLLLKERIPRVGVDSTCTQPVEYPWSSWLAIDSRTPVESVRDSCGGHEFRELYEVPKEFTDGTEHSYILVVRGGEVPKTLSLMTQGQCVTLTRK